MSDKSIIAAVVILVVLLVIFFLQRDTSSPGLSEEKTAGLVEFRELKRPDIKRFTVSRGDRTAEVVRKGDGWILASSFGYPADSEKIDRFFEELEDMDSFKKSGWSRSSHAAFEVDEKKGVRVTFFDTNDQEISSIVLGGRAPTRTLASFCYVRFGDEDVVFETEGSPRSNVGGSGDELEKDFLLHNKLFEIPDDHEIYTAELIRPDYNLILERRYEEKPKEKKDESADAEEDAEPEVEKEEAFFVASGSESWRADEKKWSVRSYLNKKDLRVDEAVDPKRDLAELGLDAPQLRVVLRHRPKESPSAGEEDSPDAGEEVVTVLFGNAIKEEKEGEEGETAEDAAYYVMLENGGRIFTIDKWAFNSWDKKLDDFREEKKDAEKPDAGADGAPESGSGETGTATDTGSAASQRPVLPPAPADAGAAPATVRASHILIPYRGADRAPGDVTRTKEEARQEAERILAEIRKGGSFADLAKAHSSCPSSADGGDLGSFPRGRMAKAFEEASFTLGVGEVSGVVETPFGFHVIKRTE